MSGNAEPVSSPGEHTRGTAEDPRHACPPCIHGGLTTWPRLQPVFPVVGVAMKVHYGHNKDAIRLDLVENPVTS